MRVTAGSTPCPAVAPREGVAAVGGWICPCACDGMLGQATGPWLKRLRPPRGGWVGSPAPRGSGRAKAAGALTAGTTRQSNPTHSNTRDSTERNIERVGMVFFLSGVESVPILYFAARVR